jgi:cell division protein FtsZ
MAGGKRASMREGPLAALFRSTSEGSQPRDEDKPGEPGEPHASQPPAQDRSAVPEPRVTAAETPPRPEVPHPSLRPNEPEVPSAPAEPRIPSPQERLRHAFSSEIPSDVLERPGAPAPPADVYARSAEPAYGGLSRPTGQPVLRVVGVGGAGVNAVNRMVEAEVEGVEFIAVNTDLQSLQQSNADITLHIGASVTRGLGSGSNPELGRQAAMEEYDKIKALLKGSDMIFITAGSGGGTGTGAAPIIARISRELGALTVGVITKPFGFEGSRRGEQAEEGVAALAEEVDTLIVVPNNRLLAVLDKNTSMVDAFQVADDVLRQGVQGVSDLVTLPGLINLDFADVRTIMSDAGPALLGIGMGTGDKRALEAASAAVASPLLETSMDGARKILLSITGGKDLSLFEVNDAAKAVSAAAHPDANIIFGAMVDEKLDDQVWVTVVATGYADSPRPARKRVEEPAGEPRVSRAADRPREGSATRRTGLGVTELDVPEFVPRR